MANSKTKKYSAAIMFTDIVNFTHHMSVNENKSLNFLDKKKSQLNNLVKKYNGSYVKDIGDGTLTWYKNANDALNCALDLYKFLKKNSSMEIRAGIHFGEIIEIKNDIYGDDVNIASRLESISPEGGICVSSLFLNKLKKQIRTDYIGLQSFKGVGRLIDVYAINDKNLKKPNLDNYSQENIILEHEKKPSLVLFPFENKGKKSDDFYAYCISADIASELSSNKEMKIASSNEVEAMLRKKYRINTICKKLSVRYWLHGSLWKKNKEFNLSIELFDNKNNSIVWSDSWMESWDNLSDIKTKLINNILMLLLNKNEYGDIYNKEKKLQNTDAYQLYLKAKYLFAHRKSENDYKEINFLLNQAINKDKNFLDPIVLFGHYYLARNHYDESLKYFENSLALSLKQKNKKFIAESLSGIGKIYYLNGKYNKAIEYFKKSHQMWSEMNDYVGIADTLNLLGAIYDYNGKYLKALKNYKDSFKAYNEVNNKIGMCKSTFNIANVYCTSGDMKNALKYQEISFTLSKETNNSVMLGYNYNLRGIVYSNLSQPNEAYELYKKSLKIRKALDDQEGVATLYRNIGVIYLQMGLLKQSIDYYNRSLSICKNIGYYIGVLDCHLQLGKVYKQMGVYDQAINYFKKSLDSVSKTEDQKRVTKIMNQIGNVYIKIGEYDKALQFYKKSQDIKKDIDDYKGIGYSILGEARINSWYGNYLLAEKQLNKCIKLGVKYIQPKLVSDSRYHLSTIFLNKYKYDDSMQEINLAIDIASNEKMHDRLAKFYDCKGLIYKFMGRLDDALEMHQKALNLSNSINDKHGYRQYLNNQGLIFEENADFENAMSIYAKCLSISKEMNEKRSICVSYCNIAFVLEYQGALDQALKYFKRSLKLAKEIKYKAGTGGYSHNIAKIYMQKSNYRKAIPYLNDAIKILTDLESKESIFSLIGRAYCFMKINKKLEFNKDIKIINKEINSSSYLSNYYALWQLFIIYTDLNKSKLANKYIDKSYLVLMERISKIPSKNNQDYFLNTNLAQLIITDYNNYLKN